MMKTRLVCVLILTAVSLCACITDFSPVESVVELEPGQTQEFYAISNYEGWNIGYVDFEYHLDDQPVGTGSSYTYTAPLVSEGDVVRQKLVVTELIIPIEPGATYVGVLSPNCKVVRGGIPYWECDRVEWEIVVTAAAQ